MHAVTHPRANHDQSKLKTAQLISLSKPHLIPADFQQHAAFYKCINKLSKSIRSFNLLLNVSDFDVGDIKYFFYFTVNDISIDWAFSNDKQWALSEGERVS